MIRTAAWPRSGPMKTRPSASSVSSVCTPRKSSIPKIASYYPLKRKGPKGTYDFEQITWDQAFDEIVHRLQAIKAAYGPEAAAIYTGRGSFELAMCDVFQPRDVAVSSASSLLFPFGSPNTMGVGALCYVSMAMIAPHVTMGGMFINMFSDLEQAELIVVWGANPATDCPPLDYKRIIEATRRGAELVVIDPRRTVTAKIDGAQWIPIRPGTDGALALALCQVLIEEELFDESFVRDWTHGFEDFARYVQHFRPEVVESITGVPADTSRALARRLAQAHGASPVMYSGLEYSDSGVQAIRATMVLWALAGQLDVPGGRCFTMRENIFPINRDGLIPNPDVKKALGRDRFPVYSLYRGESHANALPAAVLQGQPYPIRSLIILGGSMITAWPQPQVWRQTLQGLGFSHLHRYQSHRRLRLRRSGAAGRHLVRDQLLHDLRPDLSPPGTGHSSRRRSPKCLFHLCRTGPPSGLRPSLPPDRRGTSAAMSCKGRPSPWKTCVPPAARFRWIPPSCSTRSGKKASCGRTASPVLTLPPASSKLPPPSWKNTAMIPCRSIPNPWKVRLSQPELARKFPLVFNSGARVTTDFRSQFHGIPGLVKERPEPTVMLNPEDAQARGITHGDAVIVASPRGPGAAAGHCHRRHYPGRHRSQHGGRWSPGAQGLAGVQH